MEKCFSLWLQQWKKAFILWPLWASFIHSFIHSFRISSSDSNTQSAMPFVSQTQRTAQAWVANVNQPSRVLSERCTPGWDITKKWECDLAHPSTTHLGYTVQFKDPKALLRTCTSACCSFPCELGLYFPIWDWSCYSKGCCDGWIPYLHDFFKRPKVLMNSPSSSTS
jgi:hypothetical protein